MVGSTNGTKKDKNEKNIYYFHLHNYINIFCFLHIKFKRKKQQQFNFFHSKNNRKQPKSYDSFYSTIGGPFFLLPIFYGLVPQQSAQVLLFISI